MLLLMPLAAVTGIIGIVGCSLFIGAAPSMSAFATEATGLLTNSQLATLPLFLMMGSFAAVAGLADDLYRLSNVLFGRWRGGLAYATIGSCAGFGALTGSSLATAATIGRVAIPEMEARGYSPALATGVCAAGGTLGPLSATWFRTTDPVCAADRGVDRSAVRRVGRAGGAGRAALSSDCYDLCARFTRFCPEVDCPCDWSRVERSDGTMHRRWRSCFRCDGRFVFRRFHRYRSRQPWAPSAHFSSRCGAAV